MKMKKMEPRVGRRSKILLSKSATDDKFMSLIIQILMELRKDNSTDDLEARIENIRKRRGPS